MSEHKHNILDTSTKREIPAFAEIMPKVAEKTGKSFGSQLKDIARLSLGGNKITADEYFMMRLYEDDRLTSADKLKFVGNTKSQKMINTLNRINPWLGMMDDKLVFEQVLRGLGLPTTETLAIACGGLSTPKPASIDDENTLRSFLAEASFPIFGKPLDSEQSLGSTKLVAYHKATDEVELFDGRRIKTVDFWGEIVAKFSTGYLFQTCITQHPEAAALTGSGVPTIRLITLDRGEGPETFMAVIKITGGGNAADNFWRTGNLLAPINIETGEMGKAHSGVTIDAEIVTHHPDTGKAIEGVAIPYWSEAMELAIATSKLLKDAVIVGYDIAITAEGPVVVEANYGPYLQMMQIAHGEGVLNQQMLDALEHAEGVWKGKLAAQSVKRKDKAKLQRQESRQALSLKSA